MFTFWKNYVLKLLRLETITFSNATLSDINVVLGYVLSQYPKNSQDYAKKPQGNCTFMNSAFVFLLTIHV